MKHLYVFEDGTTGVHQDPTPEDYAAVDEGILQIFRFIPGSLRGEIQEYIPQSKHPTKFEPVQKCRLSSDGHDNLYHEPERL